MKNAFKVLLLLFWSTYACKIDSVEEEKMESDLTTTKTIEALEKRGFQIFQDNPPAAIKIFKEVSQKYLDIGNLKKASLTNLNISNIYDEYQHQYDSALIFANHSLNIWQQVGDTLQQANLLKYIGLLQGKAGEAETGKESIYQAIDLYEKLDYPQGLAVSEFNLANVCFHAEEYEKSAALLEKSITFWRLKGNKNRIFTNNLFGIVLYAEMKDQIKVKQLIEENLNIQKEIKLDKYLIKRFEEALELYGENEKDAH